MEKVRVGVIGDGQLVRMMYPAAIKENVQLVVLGNSLDGPAGQIPGIEHVFVDKLTNPQGIRDLAARGVDLITAEIEHFHLGALEEVSAHIPVYPDPEVFRRIQDKMGQKKYLQNLGIPVAPFYPVYEPVDIEDAFKAFGGEELILKARKGGYDGRGNRKIKRTDNFRELVGKADQWYIEQVVPFSHELAVMVGVDIRDGRLSVAPYETTETIHARHICQTTITPARVSPEMRAEAQRVARRVAVVLGSSTMYGVEMFLDPRNGVVVNEVAPRVHNSGHWTIEGAQTSQFQQHLRAVLGRPMGQTEMTAPVAWMENRLGTSPGPARYPAGDRVWGLAGIRAFIHEYGKAAEREDRKMGHKTVLAEDHEQAEAHLKVVAAAYS